MGKSSTIIFGRIFAKPNEWYAVQIMEHKPIAELPEIPPLRIPDDTHDSG